MLPTLQPNHDKSAGPPGPCRALSVQRAQLGNQLLLMGEGSWRSANKHEALVASAAPGPSAMREQHHKSRPLTGVLRGAGKPWAMGKIAVNGGSERKVSGETQQGVQWGWSGGI